LAAVYARLLPTRAALLAFPRQLTACGQQGMTLLRRWHLASSARSSFPASAFTGKKGRKTEPEVNGRREKEKITIIYLIIIIRLPPPLLCIPCPPHSRAEAAAAAAVPSTHSIIVKLSPPPSRKGEWMDERRVNRQIGED